MRTSCPNCHQKYELDNEFSGSEVYCEKCGNNFTAVPESQPRPTQSVQVSAVQKPKSSGSLKTAIEFKSKTPIECYILNIAGLLCIVVGLLFLIGVIGALTSKEARAMEALPFAFGTFISGGALCGFSTLIRSASATEHVVREILKKIK